MVVIFLDSNIILRKSFVKDGTNWVISVCFNVGAFQPFFRSHSNNSTPRREPWLFSQKTLQNIKRCVRDRYELLPYWYTTFYDNHISGMPVLK